MGTVCYVKMVGILFFIAILAISFIKAWRIGILRKFDRNFSTKTTYQLIWLAGILLITFLILFFVTYLLGFNGSAFAKEENNFDKNDELSLIFEYVAALMLDPGQIDHINKGAYHGWAMLFGLIGIIAVTGITISTITNIVQRRVNQYMNGEVRYNNIKDHFVIIGFGELALTIIEQLFQKYGNKCRILLMSSEDAKEIRRTINTVIEKEYEGYITIYRGRKDTPEDIDSLRISKAKEVFLLGEKEEINRDASNVEVLQKIILSIKKDRPDWDNVDQKIEDIEKEIAKPKADGRSSYWKKTHLKKLRKRNEKTPIMVQFEYQTTYAAFQITDISDDWKKYIEFRPFNYYENWAKKLIYTRKIKCADGGENSCINNNQQVNNFNVLVYPALDRTPITADSDKHVHLIIFSMSRMGVALGTFAAQVCHFPNFVTKGIKTRITFITPEADTESNFFRGRYSRFFEVAHSYYRDFICGNGAEVHTKPARTDFDDLLDIEFEFIKGKAEQPEIRDLLTEWAKDDKQVLSIAICQRYPSKNMAIGLYLPDIIYQKGIPVFIRQKSSGALLNQLKQNDNSKYQKYKEVYPFGMQENCYDLDDDDRIIAQLFNSFYYNIYNHTFTKAELLKAIKDKWLKLEIAHQWSNLYSVYSLKFKLNSLGLLDKDINDNNYKKFLRCDKKSNCQFETETFGKYTELMAAVEHNRWNVEKLLLGYRVYDKNERDEDYLAHARLVFHMVLNGLTYAQIEDFENKRINNEHTIEYNHLIRLRKSHESKDFAHNAIFPYVSLDNSNKRYDIFMTGNIPNILQLFNKLQDDNTSENDTIYPFPDRHF